MIQQIAKLQTWWVKFFAIAALFMVILLTPGIAHAANQDITMTPTTVSPVINPGTVYHGYFQVINQGKTGYNFLVYSTPYRVSGEDYSPEFTILPSAPNISGWLNFSSAGGYINPGQQIRIDYTISVPENTQPGGYYAAAFAETQFPKVANSITLNEQVGELFYIQVAGPVVKKGETLTWQSSFLQKPPLTSTIRIQDSGSIYFPSTITYKVTDIFGNIKYKLNTIKQLLPQTIRRITIPWTKTPSFGLFKVSATVSYLNQSQVLSTKWVLVMDTTYRIIFIVIVVVAVLIIVFRSRISSRKKHKNYKKR
jgi:hypothetical protein